MAGAIHLLVIDDHGLFREGLVRLLMAESDFRIAGNCSHLNEALGVLDRERVDVVLLDYDLGAEQGARFFDEVNQRTASARILMVTAGMTDAGMLQVLQRGASGIFLKHSPPDQLIQAIRHVMDGQMWLDPRVVRPILSGTAQQIRELHANIALVPREKSVLKGVLEGSSNKEIAAALQLSESTVKSVLQKLFARTGTRTRSQLVRLALEDHANDWLS